MKKTLCLLLSIILIALAGFSLTGCNEKKEEATKPTVSENDTGLVNYSHGVNALADLGFDTDALGLHPTMYKETEQEVGFQLESPKKGDTIAIIKTSMGTIKIRLFEKQAPNTVKNFVELAKAGKYDNVIFHRVMDNFMIQGGDYENQNGTGGKSAEGSEFEDEFCDRLLNLRGSVAMANSGADTNGSQFFINQCKEVNYQQSESNWMSVKSQLESAKGTENFNSMMNYFIQQGYTSLYNTDSVPEDVKAIYEENGGNPYLDGAYNSGDRGHTVFGQVYQGMEVVDKIASVEVDASTNKPLEDVVIKKITIDTF